MLKTLYFHLSRKQKRILIVIAWFIGVPAWLIFFAFVTQAFGPISQRQGFPKPEAFGIGFISSLLVTLVGIMIFAGIREICIYINS